MLKQISAQRTYVARINVCMIRVNTRSFFSFWRQKFPHTHLYLCLAFPHFIHCIILLLSFCAYIEFDLQRLVHVFHIVCVKNVVLILNSL